VAVAEQADLEADDVLTVRHPLAVVPGDRRRRGPAAVDGRPDAAVPSLASAAGGAREQLVTHEAERPGDDGEAEQARVDLAAAPHRAGAELRGRRRGVHGGARHGRAGPMRSS
jgi:hypothetical protein